jgi:hypothetical protein
MLTSIVLVVLSLIFGATCGFKPASFKQAVRIVRNDRIRLVVRLASDPRNRLALSVHPLKISCTLRILNSKVASSVHNNASQLIDSTGLCVTPYWIQVTLNADYPGHDHPREKFQTSRDPNAETK